MKYLLLLLVSAISIQYCKAQVSVANEKGNVVYIGVENPIKVAVYNFDCKNIDVKVDKGEIKKVKDACGEYIFTAKEPGIVKFIVNGLASKNAVVVDIVEYRIKYPPSPVAQIHILLPGKNQETGEDCCNAMIVQDNKHVSVEQMKKAIGMGSVLTNFDYNVIYRIEGFSYSIKRNGTIVTTGDNQGNKCDRNFTDKMGLLQSGDSILFHNIFCNADFKEHIALENFEVYIDK